jgi:hypothetical protein
MLIVLALVADGPIKWLHIHHVVYALILMMAAGIALMPRRLQLTLGALFVAVNMMGLILYYSEPYRYWSEARAAIRSRVASIWGSQPLFTPLPSMPMATIRLPNCLHRISARPNMPMSKLEAGCRLHRLNAISSYGRMAI